MPVTAESVVVELLAKVDGFDAKVRQATGRGKTAVKEVERAAVESAAGFTRAEGSKATATERASGAIAGASRREVAAIESVAKAAEAGAARQAAASTRGATAVSRAAATMERDTSASLGGIGTGASRIAGSLSGLLAGVGALAVAKELLSLADASKVLESQLRLATAAFGSYGQAQKDVARIAAETRGGLSETASLYGNFVRASEQMGKTQADASRATETFSKALKIGGADTNAAASATLQFGQALASGVLRGDEFNSIAEASPRILKLLADSLGVSQGALRGMAAEGKLTSDVLYRALTDRKFTAGIDAEFKQMPVTFGEAMTAVHNAAITTFGAFDRGGQFSTALANFVTDGSTGFAGLEKSAEAFGTNVRGTIEGLGSAFTPFEEAGLAVFDALGLKLSSFASDGRKEIASLLGAFDSLLNIGPGIANKFGAGGRYDSRLQSGFLAAANASDARLKGEARDRDINDRFKFKPGSPFSSQPAPIVTKPTSGGKETSGGKKTKGRKAAKSKAIDPDDTPAAFADRIATEGRNVSAGLRVLQTAVPITLDEASLQRSLDAVGDLADKGAEAFGEFVRQGEEGVHTLASTLYDQLTGRSGSFWDQFKKVGLSAVAEIAARLLTNNGGAGGGFGSILKQVGGSILGGSGLSGFADGGRIAGAGGPRSDSIVARVSAGEYIVNADAARKHGALLDAINNNRLPRFADGGPVSRMPQIALTPQGRAIAPGTGMQAARTGGGNVTLSMSVDARGATDPKATRAEVQRALAEAAPTILNIAQGRAMQGLAAASRPRLPGSLG